MRVWTVAAALAATLPSAATAKGPIDPIAFFTGRSHGEATLKVLLQPTTTVTVESIGKRGRNGTLILDQRVRQEGKEAKSRRWVLRRLAPGRYTGTLSDAVGPVTVTSDTQAVQIRYEMKDGLQVEQTLTPQERGRVMDNLMRVRKLGLIVATLQERIEKR
ncbi:DUF3833 family protein [Sphingomonas rhizophila]|uniref:DUF3833 family protein n=1 Tax=Sphingomonas rhizophila TaxID=2071607 RepID=A0A7G9SBY9_9SPHN|nr:DUF3833 family protein [Sphingomonas rhizophila]QNN65364.1 DUF3833 family protein [Sphingomonas rhizophila]